MAKRGRPRKIQPATAVTDAELNSIMRIHIEEQELARGFEAQRLAFEARKKKCWEPLMAKYGIAADDVVNFADGSITRKAAS